MRKIILTFKFLIGYLFLLVIISPLFTITFNSLLEYFCMLLVVGVGSGLYCVELLINIIREEQDVQNKIS